MVLNYISLGALIMGVMLLFYGFIYVHDIPYNIAKKRNHPNAEAIHVACWLSLFTLHAIWPIVFIWSVMKQNPLPVTLTNSQDTNPVDADLVERLERLEAANRKTLKSGNRSEVAE